MRHQFSASRTALILAVAVYGGWPSRTSAEGEIKASDRAAAVIEKVTFLGAKHLSDEELATLTGIRAGMPLDPDANRAACRAVVRKLNDMGRLLATCELVRGGLAGDEVVFAITEGPRARVDGVTFSGNACISSSLLLSFFVE